MQFLKVEKKKAEDIRQYLLSNDLFKVGYKTITKPDYVLFPIKKNINLDKNIKLQHHDIVDIDKEGLDVEKINKNKNKNQTLKEYLSDKLTKEELDELVTSFDVIGDIALIEIPDKLESKKDIIGQGVKDVQNVRTVYKKGPVKGKFRVRELEVISGPENPRTEYKEHGCKVRLNVKKVFFSPRLSHERKRIAQQVEENENILVMFAGVGPFPLVISKYCPDVNIVAIELNHTAVKYLRKNVKLNGFDNIDVVEGDVSEVYKDYVDWADRVLMPLPKSSYKYLGKAEQTLSDGRGLIHFYTLAQNFDEAIQKARDTLSDFSVRFKKIVRPYSTTHSQFVLDLWVE